MDCVKELLKPESVQEMNTQGICNECIFPRNKEEIKKTGTCPTDTSLTYAAGMGKLSCVKELIAAGADVNAVCECHGKGALQHAVKYGHADCLTELIEAGAKVNMQNKNGNTALMFTTNIAFLNHLITAGADVNIKNKEGNTVLMYAVQNGNVDFVKKLISAGADVNVVNNKKDTPLMIAARKGHVECLKELISAGANRDKRDKYAKNTIDDSHKERTCRLCEGTPCFFNLH